MPFRQLPNTDATRVAALDDAALKAASTAPGDRPYPAALQTELDAVQLLFKEEVGDVHAALNQQTTATTQVETDFLALQTVVSHFIQVFNLAVARGVYPRTDRAWFGLDVNSQAVPPLTAHADAITWGERIVTGETRRNTENPTSPPMANPSAQDVETALDAFRTSSSSQTTAKDTYDAEQEDVAGLRPRVDKLIRDLWDHIEFTYREDNGPSRRRKCREWGVVYVPRPGEAPDPEEAETPETPEPPTSDS